MTWLIYCTNFHTSVVLGVQGPATGEFNDIIIHTQCDQFIHVEKLLNHPDENIFNFIWHFILGVFRAPHRARFNFKQESSTFLNKPYLYYLLHVGDLSLSLITPEKTAMSFPLVNWILGWKWDCFSLTLKVNLKSTINKCTDAPVSFHRSLLNAEWIRYQRKRQRT